MKVCVVILAILRAVQASEIELRSECASKHLPCQKRLGDKAENYVHALAVQIVGPFSLSLELLVLNNCKTVEEKEQ